MVAKIHRPAKVMGIDSAIIARSSKSRDALSGDSLTYLFYFILEQLFNLLLAEIDERERATGGAGQVGFEIVTQAAVDRGHDFGRFDRAFCRNRADRIAATDDFAPLDAASGKINGPALRPVV